MGSSKRRASDITRQPFARPQKGFARLRTTEHVARRMARVRQRGTAPELAVRRLARSLGLRFTTENRDLPGSPDLANRSKQMAVFVHGCYWHRHPDCVKASVPKTNRRFWERKFERNEARDSEAVAALGTMGYRVAVIWECEASDSDLVAERLGSLARRGGV